MCHGREFGVELSRAERLTIDRDGQGPRVQAPTTGEGETNEEQNEETTHGSMLITRTSR